jgi:peptidoglycan/xylan/chitin deacetylase (PgdA/CDA1 family)
MDPGCPDLAEVVMTAEELVELPENLAEIGSHTRTHPRLTELSDAAARAELEGSREDLERELGRRVEVFAFPYGDHDERIVGLCKEAGYRRVFDIDPGVTALLPQEYVIPRVPVSAADSILEFRLKLLGAYSWMSRVSALKRRINL